MICLKCQADVEAYANGKKCRKCYNEYMRGYMLRRYREFREYYVEKLGGTCVDCGTTSNLEFDHVHPFGKRYPVSAIMLHSKEKRENELAKCVLRCNECHKGKTSAQRSVPHGGGASGKSGCKCRLCKDKKNEYMRNWKANKKAKNLDTPV